MKTYIVHYVEGREYAIHEVYVSGKYIEYKKKDGSKGVRETKVCNYYPVKYTVIPIDVPKELEEVFGTHKLRPYRLVENGEVVVYSSLKKAKNHIEKYIKKAIIE